MGAKPRIAIRILAAVVVTAGSLIPIGRVLSERRVGDDIDALLDLNSGCGQEAVTEADLATLPEPVRRWLHWSGVVGRPIPRTVRLTQSGDFRLAEDKGWMPFTAEQVYTTDPPGFVWSVSMEMMPLVSVIGRDRYQLGEGNIDMRVLGIVPVAQKRGGQLNEGALLRYLNEIMWFPAAALRPYITWSPIDSLSAKATITDGGMQAEAIFTFDREGKLITMTANRPNDAKGETLPWSTPITAYGKVDGIMIPTGGTGVWHYETGDFPYIRLGVTSIHYDVLEDCSRGAKK